MLNKISGSMIDMISVAMIDMISGIILNRITGQNKQYNPSNCNYIIVG